MATPLPNQPTHPRPRRRFGVGLVVLAGAAVAATLGDDPPRTTEETGDPVISFRRDIRPILETHCVKCHGQGSSKGGFSIETRASMLEHDEAVVPGRPEESLLLALVRGDDPLAFMPAEGSRLTDHEIRLLTLWIEQGAPWDADVSFGAPAATARLQPRRPELPPVRDGRVNPIDRILTPYFEEHGVAPGPVIDDRTFLRRAFLDIIGLLPPVDAIQRLETDPHPDRRGRFVRELLATRPAYTEHWLTFWNDLLRNDYSGTGYIDGGRTQITEWLYKSLYDNKPYDELVSELVNPSDASAGFANGITWRGDVNASQIRELQYARSVSQVFLGINMKCASCHDSFIDGWKLADAYGLAAIFAEAPLEIHRCEKPTGRIAAPGFIFPELGQVDPDAPREARLSRFAELMTHPDNGRLTRTIVNRIWQRMMGRGIVEPVDEMDAPPWSADLLDFLAVHLSDNGYDLKRTIELIATSRAYQMPTVPSYTQDGSGAYVFRGPVTRRMTAEQFVDAIWMLTGAGPSAPDAAIVDGDRLGAWIWSRAEASDAAAPGEQFTFRRRFELPAEPESALAALTCDNEYVLSVNGRRVAADADWPTVETVDFTDALDPGENEIVIVARNLGDRPNPAGLFLRARIRLTNGDAIDLATDASWQWTAPAHDDAERVVDRPDDWRPAIEVRNQQFLGEGINRQIDAAVARFTHTRRPLVRASLVNADLLMRSLGRPNREQVVSSRPDKLTTLEALDLTNGTILADLLRAGAAHLLDDRERRGADLVDHLFLQLLSRPPSERERAQALRIMGPDGTPEGLEDLLWVLIMLPDFQMIR